MKTKLKKTAIAASIAGALLFAAPSVAQAYVPTGPNTVTVTVTTDGPVAINGFQAGTDVEFTLAGVDVTAANLASAARPVKSTSLTKTADASGVATAVVTLPANPVGTYTLSATGARAENGGGGSNNGGGTNNGGTNALPETGVNGESLMGIYIGGGALVLAGATVAVAAKVRRNRAENKA